MGAVADLGTEGQSSDEDEGLDDDNVRRFGIIRKEWRSAKLARFLFIITKFGVRYNDSRKVTTAASRPRHGPTDRVSLTRPVAGLPINFYDAKWLASLSDFERARLNIKPDEYDLTIPEDVLA